MANVETYIIQLKDRFTGPMGKATASMDTMHAKTKGLNTALLGTAAAAAGAFAVMAGAKLISTSIRNWDKQQNAIAQVRQGLESTGMVAGRTLSQLERQAASLQKNSLFGDEDILGSVTAQLLTFTNITASQFDKAQQAVLDFTARYYGANASAEALRASSVMLGKALNDPVANLGALSRSGIQFSESQKETIKQMAQTGRLAEAQQLILKELGVQYGGAAKAAAEAGLGPLRQFQMSLADITEEIGEKLAPHLLKLVEYLNRTVTFFERNGAAILRWTRIIALVINPLLRIVALFVKLVSSGRQITAFFSGLGAVFENIGERLENLGQRFANVFFASTGQFAKIKKVEKVGETVGEAYQRGIENGNAKYMAKRVDQDGQIKAFTPVRANPALPVSGGAGSSRTTTTISGSAPKVFNINIEKVTGVETIETTNMRQSASVVGNEVAAAIAESLADIQTIAS